MIALDPESELIIDPSNLPATADALRDVLQASDRLFERGVPVRIVVLADGGPPSAHPLTTYSVIREAHRLCRPVHIRDGERKLVTLPHRLAGMYLDMAGEWGLRRLAGITTAPLLGADGNIRSIEGYDTKTGLWCRGIPEIVLSMRPTRADADAALLELRETFCTFPFADAQRLRRENSMEAVDLSAAPGHDESAFLVALVTAVCRASLWLAPGFLITAAAVSGAGSGKGLLARAICMIAFGMRPRAFTAGSERAELDKRLAAELVEAQPALFLDNLNGVALRSDLLASILTERPARVRILGETRMAELNSTAFIAVTGNGLTVTEDLARRFVACHFDVHCEDPELHHFPVGFIEQIERRRGELLSAVLTIWRWGRQNAPDLTPGVPLGSYETWAEWCRDPLLTLGCRDPVERIALLKANDPRRQFVRELFSAWWEAHGSKATKANELADRVKEIIDPQKRGRQYIARRLVGLSGTRAAGFVLTRQDPAGTWGAATYALVPTTDRPEGAARGIDHRTHRTHRRGGDPMSPIGPIPDAAHDAEKSRERVIPTQAAPMATCYRLRAEAMPEWREAMAPGGCARTVVERRMAGRSLT